MIYLIYHQVKRSQTDCPDGICALWIAYNALAARSHGETIQIVGDQYLGAIDYADIDYALPFTPRTGDQVYLLDFGYPRHILERILDTGAVLTILDHHIGKMGDISTLADRINGGLSLDDCGATYAWKYFNPHTAAPWFLKYVFQRDTGADGYYDGDIPESEAIAIAMSSRRAGLTGMAAFPVFEELLNAEPAELMAEGMPQIVERDALVEAELKVEPLMVHLSGYWVPLLIIQNPKCDRHYSIVGSWLARRYGWAAFVVVLTTDQVAAHLRSTGFNTVPIAQANGGGGHEKASGFKIPAAWLDTLERSGLLERWSDSQQHGRSGIATVNAAGGINEGAE
jgi:uncharacterized protein